MVLLTERSVERWRDERGQWHEKLTQEQRGEQCYAWAHEYADTNPQLADDLRHAARVFGETLYVHAGTPKMY